jgi:flavin reductase (DIM6/NTAB) family NADH-FMN oxidoreductase RutF
MMASWVMQAGFEPPTLAIAIAKSRPIVQLIRESRKLALSIVPAEDKTLMKFYARYKGETDPFVGIATQPAPSGISILSDALGYLDCTLKQTVEIGTDHDLYIAEVVDGASFRDGTAFAHQRGNGFHY